MSKKLILAGAAALSFAVAPQASYAATISTTFEANGALPAYSLPAATIVQGFTGATNATPYVAGPNETVTGSVYTLTTNPGFPNAATPSGSQPTYSSGAYLSIGAVNSQTGVNKPASYSLSFTAPVNFVSFVFGTLDAYNSVTLNFANSASLTLTGAQIATGLLSTVFNDTTTLNAFQEGRVSYNIASGDTLKSIAFTSTNTAFEIDSIATAAPEPATWAMMLLGFGLVGSQLRRRGRKPVLATA